VIVAPNYIDIREYVEKYLNPYLFEFGGLEFELNEAKYVYGMNEEEESIEFLGMDLIFQNGQMDIDWEKAKFKLTSIILRPGYVCFDYGKMYLIPNLDTIMTLSN
jgi:hypothetical protein